MKTKKLPFLLLLLLLHFTAFSQSFKYAFVSDTHVGASTGEEDLRRTIADINAQKDLDFVVITGDITEMGTNDELKLAKQLFSALRIPYYIMPGNHDTGWSESGGVSFIKEFGYDKFMFDHKGYRFIACASGPYVRMSDGHIPRDATVWLDKVLKKTAKDLPIIFLNHYPIDESLDNWYEITDRLKTKNIQYIINGHGHQNQAMNFEGIPATMGRSNLRAKDSIGGYNIVTMSPGMASFAIKKPGQKVIKPWRTIELKPFVHQTIKAYDRPSYAVNEQFPKVKALWTYHSSANVVNTPAVADGKVVFGNSLGLVEALQQTTGERLWKFQTKGAIYSSALIQKGLVVLGSGDGNIYALNLKNGKLKWKFTASNAVLGSPALKGDTIFIGSSDNRFRAINLNNGKLIWEFDQVEGTVVDKPLIYEDKIIFGSWGRHLYALATASGKLMWKWNNGSANRMLSPAMCSPVAVNGVVFIAAPDRFLTAIAIDDGKTLWRTKDAMVRESIGLSADGTTIYGKTMQDEIVAFKTSNANPELLWKLNADFGYEHTPSDLIEKDGLVYFGTKNGVVYTFDAKTHKMVWRHKIDNSMINTVNAIGNRSIVVSTMDGKVCLLKELE